MNPLNDVAGVLLAKSPRGDRLVSLAEHCLDTEKAARVVFRPDGRWSRSWARFFRFQDSDRRRFLLNLRVAGLFHDVGKANEEFQAAVTGTAPGRRQTLRHEHFSALILALPDVRSWLGRHPDLDVDAITAAVLSHHMKATEHGVEWAWGRPCTVADQAAAHVRLHLDHPAVREIFARVQDLAGLSRPPELPGLPWTESSALWADALCTGTRAALAYRRAINRRAPQRRPLLWAVKAGLVVADSVASGVVRVGGDIEDWIESVVHRPALTGEELARAIIDKRVAEIERLTRKPFVFHRFQTLAASQGEKALLLAGCGAGKTLAAWKWAQAALQERELGHVVFLYPTRGTATEGFRDYVGWAPEEDAALVHLTARYEIEAMTQNPGEHLFGRKFLDEAEARLYALGLWRRRYFSATADQFLGFLEHSYTGICLLPLLADSAIVIDEIHSFDRRMFGNLKALLAHFDVTVLCMTATLPRWRRADLEQLGLRVFPTPEHRGELQDLERQEKRPRYRIRRLSGPEIALEEALETYRRGGKTLWVVNTVDRCQEIAGTLRRHVDSVLVYHSRFRLGDRHRAHDEVVKAFKEGRPVLAVTTQVCEMSLDLDADQLITELAPVTSLVQRFGRSSRSQSRASSHCAEVLWYEPARSSPYEDKDLDSARGFLAGLGRGTVSQRELAERLDALDLDEPLSDESAAFLTSGYFAVPGSFREKDEHSQSCVLEEDVETVTKLVAARKSYDAYILPVPRGAVLDEEKAPRPSTFPKFLGIVSSARYDPLLGFFRCQEVRPCVP